MKQFLYLTILLGFGANHAMASRAYVPIGDQVRRAVVVALADTRPADPARRTTILTLREIIKGDPTLMGEEIIVTRSMSTAAVALPREASGIAVLLVENWKTQDEPLLEAYQQAHEIEALRGLVAIYERVSERAQLLALKERITEANPLFRKQIFQDLTRMREAGNFDILLNLFPKGEEATQREVVALLGQIGDLRGVPTLISALNSPHQSVALDAATALSYPFRGAPGVTEAFRRVLSTPPPPQHEHLKYSAEWYLKSYDVELAAKFEARRNPYQRASDRLQSGDEAGARPFFDLILSDPAQTESLASFSSDWIARIIQNEPDKADEIRRALLPVLTRYSREDNYLQAISAAKLLVELQHPDSDAPLLDLLKKADNFLFDTSTRTAAYALFDRGAACREQVVNLLKARKDWPVLQPLFEEFADEGHSLTTLLQSGLDGGKTLGAEDWIIHRLGALREQRAVETLIQYLIKRPWSDPYVAIEALTKIGGAEVEAAALGLLNDPDENGVRRQATDLIFRLQDARALPLARRMLTEADFGFKSSAALFLARHGTPEDLNWLVPLSDFWTGDRANHSWLMSAVSEIRHRHGYDLSVPIKRP
jgi:HEAT repeat protein